MSDDRLVTVQHAVVIQNGTHLRALNDLLSLGWRVISTAASDNGVFVVIQHVGTEATIREMRQALGYLDDLAPEA